MTACHQSVKFQQHNDCRAAVDLLCECCCSLTPTLMIGHVSTECQAVHATAAINEQNRGMVKCQQLLLLYSSVGCDTE